MNLSFRSIILICFLSCTSREQAGHVIKVVDGDTFDLKSGDEKIRVRLFGIDSPERGQAFNVRAKEFTAGLIAGKDVRVVIRNKDRYGRFVGDVYLSDGKYVNAEIVRAGYAWHFTRYSNDKQLAELQDEARENKRGLWFDKNPIPPWEFRRH